MALLYYNKNDLITMLDDAETAIDNYSFCESANLISNVINVIRDSPYTAYLTKNDRDKELAPIETRAFFLWNKIMAMDGL